MTGSKPDRRLRDGHPIKTRMTTTIIRPAQFNEWQAVSTTLCLEALDEQASGGPASMRRDHAGECTGGGSGAAGLLAGLLRPSEAADQDRWSTRWRARCFGSLVRGVRLEHLSSLS